MKLGDVTVTRVEEMHGPIMPTDVFFPTMPASLWQQNEAALVPDHLNPADRMVHVAMQIWVLRSEGRTILVDTGGFCLERQDDAVAQHRGGHCLDILQRRGEAAVQHGAGAGGGDGAGGAGGSAGATADGSGPKSGSPGRRA